MRSNVIIVTMVALVMIVTTMLIAKYGAYGFLEKNDYTIFRPNVSAGRFFCWFLGLWTSHSCRENFVTNLFTEILDLALTISMVTYLAIR